MNIYDKCKSCKLYNDCEYIKLGSTCNSTIHASAYEEEFSCINGDPVQIELQSRDSDVRLDLVVEKKHVAKLWGQVKDVEGNIIDCAMVTLLKPQYIRGKIEYFPLNTTFSDSLGFYHFEIDKLDKGLQYVVSVSK